MKQKLSITIEDNMIDAIENKVNSGIFIPIIIIIYLIVKYKDFFKKRK